MNDAFIQINNVWESCSTKNNLWINKEIIQHLSWILNLKTLYIKINIQIITLSLHFIIQILNQYHIWLFLFLDKNSLKTIEIEIYKKNFLLRNWICFLYKNHGFQLFTLKIFSNTKDYNFSTDFYLFSESLHKKDWKSYIQIRITQNSFSKQVPANAIMKIRNYFQREISNSKQFKPSFFCEKISTICLFYS